MDHNGLLRLVPRYVANLELNCTFQTRVYIHSWREGMDNNKYKQGWLIVIVETNMLHNAINQPTPSLQLCAGGVNHRLPEE